MDIGLFIATYKQKVPVSHSAECWIVNLQSFVGTKLVCIVTETSGASLILSLRLRRGETSTGEDWIYTRWRPRKQFLL